MSCASSQSQLEQNECKPMGCCIQCNFKTDWKCFLREADKKDERHFRDEIWVIQLQCQVTLGRVEMRCKCLHRLTQANPVISMHRNVPLSCSWIWATRVLCFSTWTSVAFSLSSRSVQAMKWNVKSFVEQIANCLTKHIGNTGSLTLISHLQRFHARVHVSELPLLFCQRGPQLCLFGKRWDGRMNSARLPAIQPKTNHEGRADEPRKKIDFAGILIIEVFVVLPLLSLCSCSTRWLWPSKSLAFSRASSSAQMRTEWHDSHKSKRLKTNKTERNHIC